MTEEHEIYFYEKPCLFSVRMSYTNGKRVFGTRHVRTVGIVAISVMAAAQAANRAYPEHRIDAINEMGQVDIIVDSPVSTLEA